MSLRALFLAGWLFSLGALFFFLPPVSERRLSLCDSTIHDHALLREVGYDVLETLLSAKEGLSVRHPVLLDLAAHIERTGGGALDHTEIHSAEHLPAPFPAVDGDFFTCKKKLLLRSRKAYTIFVTYSLCRRGGSGRFALLTGRYSFR